MDPCEVHVTDERKPQRAWRGAGQKAVLDQPCPEHGRPFESVYAVLGQPCPERGHPFESVLHVGSDQEALIEPS